MPRISILIPVYNGEQYIEKAVRSVIAQSFTDWELIALDDGSTDGSRQILERLATKDCRIKLMQKENDGNGNTAANIMIMGREAKGEYAFYMSQDDWLSTDLFELAVKRTEETGAEVVIPEMPLAYADGTTRNIACSVPPGGDFDAVLTGKEAFELSIDFRINGFALIKSTLMFDRRCDNRFFDSDELNTRLQYLWANKVAFCRGKFYYYQGNENAMTKKFSAKMFQRLCTSIMLDKAFAETFPRSDKKNRQRYAVLKAWQMHTYVSLAVAFLSHGDGMTANQKASARGMFRDFERGISFRGLRLAVLRRLTKSEAVFAVFYFLFGSCLKMKGLHAVYHKLKRT